MSDKIIDTIAVVLADQSEYSGFMSCCRNRAEHAQYCIAPAVLAALKAHHIALTQLPEQHIGYQAENTITEFRFGDHCAGITLSRDDDGQPRIYVIGGQEEMTLPAAREFFTAGLAAVTAAEEVTQ